MFSIFWNVECHVRTCHLGRGALGKTQINLMETDAENMCLVVSDDEESSQMECSE